VRLLTALLALTAGCFRPAIGEGDFKCGQDPDCPPGFPVCSTCDNRCYSHDPGGICMDGSIVQIDGAVIDAPVASIDAPFGTPDARRYDARKTGTPDAFVADGPWTVNKPDANKGKDGGTTGPCNNNGHCDIGEQWPCRDCTRPYCGNGICETVAGETCFSCPGDCTTGCGSTCNGNLVCEPASGETCACSDCTSDCLLCGNGMCDPTDCLLCPADCPPKCDGGSCTPPTCGPPTKPTRW
jgi:hypothetical protein